MESSAPFAGDNPLHYVGAGASKNVVHPHSPLACVGTTILISNNGMSGGIVP